MITQPTPQQYARVAQLLQRHTQKNPNVLQQGGTFYSNTPSAQGDWDFGPMVRLPTVVTPGYAVPRNGGAVVEEPQSDPGIPQPLPGPTGPIDGGYNWAARSFQYPHTLPNPGGPKIGIPDKPGPFLQHAKALTAATRSNVVSHQQALLQKFMENAQAKLKGVRK